MCRTTRLLQQRYRPDPSRSLTLFLSHPHLDLPFEVRSSHWFEIHLNSTRDADTMFLWLNSVYFQLTSHEMPVGDLTSRSQPRDDGWQGCDSTLVVLFGSARSNVQSWLTFMRG